MDAPEEIRAVSGSRLACACTLGGCTFNGSHYTYDRARDVLVRDDVQARRDAAAGLRPGVATPGLNGRGKTP